MANRKEHRNSGIRRHIFPSQRTSTIRVISFDRLLQTEHVVHFVDLSVVGVGIESSEPVEAGLVYFKEQVAGHKFGVVAWCRQNGDRCRAGINFLTLPIEKEQYVLNEVKRSQPRRALRDPDKVIASLFESINPARSERISSASNKEQSE